MAGLLRPLRHEQTPYVDFEETVYRYRFQGTSSWTAKATSRRPTPASASGPQFPSNYGEVHAGFYNGEAYTRADANDQKAFQIRGTLRPFPGPACSAACA